MTHYENFQTSKFTLLLANTGSRYKKTSPNSHTTYRKNHRLFSHELCQSQIVPLYTYAYAHVWTHTKTHMYGHLKELYSSSHLIILFMSNRYINGSILDKSQTWQPSMQCLSLCMAQTSARHAISSKEFLISGSWGATMSDTQVDMLLAEWLQAQFQFKNLMMHFL